MDSTKTLYYQRVLHPTLNLAMDLAGGSAAQETKIILYTASTGANQVWNFNIIGKSSPKLVDKATYIITNSISDTVIDVYEDGPDSKVSY